MDICILASIIKNLKILYCNRYANILGDRQCNVQTISIINNISLFGCVSEKAMSISLSLTFG